MKNGLASIFCNLEMLDSSIDETIENLEEIKKVIAREAEKIRQLALQADS